MEIFREQFHAGPAFCAHFDRSGQRHRHETCNSSGLSAWTGFRQPTSRNGNEKTPYAAAAVKSSLAGPSNILITSTTRLISTINRADSSGAITKLANRHSATTHDVVAHTANTRAPYRAYNVPAHLSAAEPSYFTSVVLRRSGESYATVLSSLFFLFPPLTYTHTPHCAR